LLGQKIQITSPADGVLVHSGETLTVTVAADSSAFESVGVDLLATTGFRLPLFAPPYVFSLQIAPDASSGTYALTPFGTLKSGGDVVGSDITIDVERADSPRQLRSELSVIYFHYVGDSAPTIVTGVFADGARVMLTRSTYIAYSSDTPGVATVDEQGAVTAVAPGEANITIRYGNASLGTTSIRVPVYVPVPITVIASTGSLYPLQTEKFTTTLFMDPNLDQSVVWSITPGVGSIDQTGLYTAPSSVSARVSVTVTATSVGDPTKSASAQVWIRPRQRNK
jgi:hypothetical protein